MFTYCHLYFYFYFLATFFTSYNKLHTKSIVYNLIESSNSYLLVIFLKSTTKRTCKQQFMLLKLAMLDEHRQNISFLIMLQLTNYS